MEKTEIMIPTITKANELAACPVLKIGHYKWSCRKKPEAFARLAYLHPGKLLVSLTCKEPDPRRTLTEHNDPVYLDSALEFFLKPFGCRGYFNFECNANGAMLAMYGPNVAERAMFSPKQFEPLHLSADLQDDSWTVTFETPEALLQAWEAFPSWETEPSFTFNLYKISETPEIEHYGSFAPIRSPVPNFHRPKDFAIGRITPQA